MNIVLEISYVGLNYFGYQIQPNKKTVQGELENAIKKVLGYDVKTIASGRTDANVSAIKQVVNFNCDKINIPVDRLKYVLNEVLPLDIRVNRSYLADDNFNARFNAKTKTYEYYFYYGDVENAYYSQNYQFFKGNLDIENMKKACSLLVGEHDFKSFVASDTDVKSTVREIYNADIIKVDSSINCYKLVISGNGFLYNMVRIIMGTLLDIGYQKHDFKYMEFVIKQKNRKFAGPTVDAIGLVLKNVEY